MIYVYGYVYMEMGMGAYTVPEEIRKMKPVGTIIKVVKGNYYVYTNSRHKDQESGKWKTDPGKLLGKIMPDLGFVPKETPADGNGMTCFDYGQYILSSRLAGDDYRRLKEFFTVEEAAQIFALASMFAFEGYVGLKPTEELFETSLIAHDYPSLKYTYHRISGLLSGIGRNDRILDFQRRCLEDADTLAVDGHVIPSDNEGSDLSFNGYKAREAKGEQMNLLVAIDVDTHLPLATRVFPGYMVDKSDFTEFLAHFGRIDGKLLIMDSGFYSKDNIDCIRRAGADYIMPLSSNMSAYKAASRPMKGRLSQFLYSTGRKTDLVEYREFAIDGKRLIYFRNESEKEKLTKEYMAKIGNGAKGYTEEGLEKGLKAFGVIILETSLQDKPEEIYRHYKTRWSIETYYDRIKNGSNFKELNLSEYGMVQGIAFVMMLAGRIDQRILHAAKEVKKTSKDLVRLMRALKLFDNGKSRALCNMKKEHIAVAKTLGFSYDLNLKCLDS